MKYIVEGSFKGIVTGAGIVVIEDNGKAKEYSFKELRVDPNSLIAEAFAIKCVIKLILETKKRQENITICTNNMGLFNYQNNSVDTHFEYVNDVIEKINLLKKYANLTIEGISPQIELEARFAQSLSREYLKDETYSLLPNGL
ncbi:hypothetical protein BKP45_16195 [Anaerobacillus alkalidiazotrophicus]|uniref:RNase H type-1 domain-containing protein n=1 Tax=Anaerobacillus alkalidiazotrophicus TaxID=472963 RepID=A0A1S2M2C6_9BACI|nr:reverse transcriptase-like protein [Anaerobacillus alkalidiazotrophicus]OIJ18670.1 hypothetical protein BKP45_16195 [Anaerobacillus alkalidiazotrophicus]